MKNNTPTQSSLVLKLYSILFFALTIVSSQCLAEERPSTAFYYANHLPLELLSTYQRVVVEPDNVTSEELNFLKQHGVRVYAYFSIGEIGPERTWLSEIDPNWILGVNPGWKSKVMDMSQSGWRHYVIEKQLQALKNRGFDAFFLDTMDSYQLFAKNPDAQLKQQQGMIELIQNIKQHFGEVHLLFNRGFEVLDKVANLCDGVVAESLFKGWDPGKSSYKDVNDNDRTWLLNKLNSIKQKYKLPITVLDYLPPKDRTEADKVAAKIKALGFIPWISTPALDYMGVGELDLIPRKVLLLYDSEENRLSFNNAHRLLAMPLEQLGYVPEYLDIRTPLPEYILQGRYAGIISWMNSSTMGSNAHFAAWIQKQLQNNVKLVFMHTFPFINNAELKQTLNLEANNAILPTPINLEILSKNMGYETAPLPRRLDLTTVQPKDARNSWLKVHGAAESISEPVFTAEWGGMALSPYVFFEIPDIQNPDATITRWIINPFAFLQQALQLPEIPIADNTTENGRRILTIHIDGDGFYNKTESRQDQYSPELVMQEFLLPSQLPHTVSIIEGEIGLHGLKPELSPQLETIAKKIFSLPNVEIASHSYSHPFDWLKASETAKHITDSKTQKELRIDSEKRYTLPIPGYKFSPEREIAGSLNYINTRLAPAHKKARVFLWTGDALPDEETIAWAEKMHVANMNGGTTITHNGILSLANISPSGIVRGEHFQPYAPVQNENSLSNDWRGPFYGYQEVINTFKLTDFPQRLKPISIYYHFYSGDKTASVEALKRVYTWAQTQTTLPLWISEYTPRLYAFRDAVFERSAQGWKIHHANNLRTLRLPSNSSVPNLSASTGIAGFKNIPQGLYLNLVGQDEVNIHFDSPQNTSPYLDSSNAQIESWQKNGEHISFSLKGHQPVTLALGNFNAPCTLSNTEHKTLHGLEQNTLHVFNFDTSETGKLYLTCEKA